MVGCSLYKNVPVYQKSYYGPDKEKEALNDVYWWMDAYRYDPVPLEDWLQFQDYVEDGYKIERVFQRKWNDETEIIMIHTTCICDSTSYHVLIKYRTKDKSLWIQ